MADPKAMCLQCYQLRGAIRRDGLICAGVDDFGEVDWEADRHRFTHAVAVRNEQPGEALWYTFCACGWGAFGGARFVTREDARLAARAHRSQFTPASPATEEAPHE